MDRWTSMEGSPGSPGWLFIQWSVSRLQAFLRAPLKKVPPSPYRAAIGAGPAGILSSRGDSPMVDEQNLENPNAEPSAGEQDTEALQARVLELEEQLAAAQDQVLRSAADMQNVRRRAEQDVEKAHKFALEKF